MTRVQSQTAAQYNRQQSSICIENIGVRPAKMTMQHTVAPQKEYTNSWSQTIQVYSDYLIRY